MSEGKYTKKYDPKTQEWIVRRIRTVPKQNASEAYRRNYADIDWRKKDEQDEAGPGGGAKKDSEEEDTHDDEQSDD